MRKWIRSLVLCALLTDLTEVSSNKKLIISKSTKIYNNADMFLHVIFDSNYVLALNLSSRF